MDEVVFDTADGFVPSMPMSVTVNISGIMMTVGNEEYVTMLSVGVSNKSHVLLLFSFLFSTFSLALSLSLSLSLSLFIFSFVLVWILCCY